MILKPIIILPLIFSIAYSGRSPHGEEYLANIMEEYKLNVTIAEDSLLDVPGLLKKYGYPAETHTVQTEDGYLLQLHRIPYGKNPPRADRPPILLMHGLFSSSADWIIMGTKDGLGYTLADEGYDVWMGNARGNFYSRNHTTLDPESSKFWKFSWNEIGYYDLPAMIDHILTTTGKKQLDYIGHSQGTTAFFVMGSTRKEYNDKIQSMQALAPAAYLTNSSSPIITFLAPRTKLVKTLMALLGVDEFLPSTPLMKMAAQVLCNENSTALPICTNILFLLCGYNPAQLNITMLPIILGHTPAGAATQQMIHYGQLFLADKFRKYDYGKIMNLIKYKSETPPEYELQHVTSPIAFHYSDNDWLVSKPDMERLYKQLPNTIGKYRVPDDKFNHLDFLWAIDVQKLLYKKVIEILKTFNK